MKPKFLLLSMASLLLLLLAACSPKGNATTSFWVRGNCEMCEATIEKALGATPGVVQADYDLATHTLNVEYDSAQVAVDGLHKACAAAGYDTKLATATAQAYADLPKCCKKPEDQ
jgi:copper chaperone CopZ